MLQRALARHLVNPCLLPEEDLQVDVRYRLAREARSVLVSLRISRPDRTWYACTVDSRPGPTAAADLAHLYLCDGIEIVCDAVPPF